MKVYKTLAELKSALYPRNRHYYDHPGGYVGFWSRGWIWWYVYGIDGLILTGSTKGAEGAERREWKR